MFPYFSLHLFVFSFQRTRCFKDVKLSKSKKISSLFVFDVGDGSGYASDIELN